MDIKAAIKLKEINGIVYKILENITKGAKIVFVM